MRTEPIENKFGKPLPYPISFGYSHYLKNLYKKGLIKPKYGIYGDKLTKKNVTLEHILCRSKGGETELNNLALATSRMNNARGDKPLSDFLSAEGLAYYCDYFMHIKLPELDGVKYIKGLLETINKVLDKENGKAIHLDKLA